MTHVNVARLKAQLSRYLRAVRNGEEIVVTDRNLPIAKVVPICEETPFKLEVSAPVKKPEELCKLRFPRGRDVDTLAALLEERRNER